MKENFKIKISRTEVQMEYSGTQYVEAAKEALEGLIEKANEILDHTDAIDFSSDITS